MEPIIKISHLNKSYKDVKAVNDLSFTVNRGELFAFLGVNGAGKSTTIHIICSQLSPTWIRTSPDLNFAFSAGESTKTFYRPYCCWHLNKKSFRFLHCFLPENC